MLTNERQSTATAVAKELKVTGFTTSVLDKNTVIRHARAAAAKDGQKLRAVRGRPKNELTQQTKMKRLAFAKTNQKRDWSNVLFTDRKKFVFRWPGTKVAACRWECTGAKGTTRKGAYQPSHPQNLNVYAGISRYGVTNVHIVAGTSKYKHQHTNKQGALAKNLTASQYREVLTPTLLPGGQRAFGVPGIASWV